MIEMPFKNVGDIRVARTGRSLEIRIYPRETISGSERLYIDLDKIIQVLARKMKKTSIARPV